MFTRWFIGAFVAALLLPGCGNTCKRDTDCVLPEVCIGSTCINPYFPDGMPDLQGDFELPDGWPDTDNDKTNYDGQDIPDGMETDGVVPCSPQMSQRYQILGTDVESEVDEHAEVVTLADNSFYILGRKFVSGVENPYKLTLIKIRTSGQRGGDPLDIFGAPSLPGYHQLLARGNDMGVLFKAPPALPDNKIVYINVSTATMIPTTTINGISVTDANSSDPYGVDNTRNLFVVYKEASDDPAVSTIESCFVEYAGETATAGLRLGGDGTTNVGEPVVSYGGGSYLLAYFYHGIPADGQADRLMLLEVSSDGAPIETGGQEVSLKSANNILVGRPAIAWAGDRWAVLWQEAEGTGDTSSYIHLTTRVPGNAATDVDITPQWSEKITVFSSNQPGELDMVWNGNSLGVVIKHDGGTAGRKVYFGEFEVTGTIIGGVVTVTPDASTTFAPSVTFMHSATERYYLYTWLQLTPSSIHQTYVSTYGCTAP